MKLLIVLMSLLAGIASAHEYNGGRPDGHAPIGVMGDHRHKAGETMLSYRYMGMRSSGAVNGSDSLSTDEVLATYMMAPKEMDMAMHMVGGMWAPSDLVTLAMGLKYVQKDMTMQRRMPAGSEGDVQAEGFGDIQIMSIWNVGLDNQSRRVHFNLGVSIPTGDIDQEDTANPANPKQQLPYGMQNGSGTLDISLGATMIEQTEGGSWGAQLMGLVRTEDNDRGYRHGNQLMATAWAQKNLSATTSASVRLKQTEQGRIRGEDGELVKYMTMMMTTVPMSPSVFPENYGYSLTEVGLGANWIGKKGMLNSHRFAVEYLHPIAQRASGTQMKRKGAFVLGWQKAFH